MKNLKNLGTQLSKAEQKQILGGLIFPDDPYEGCPWSLCMNSFGRCSRIACL